MIRPHLSPDYQADKVVAKYIGYISSTLMLYEVNDHNQTLRSYPADKTKLSQEHLDAASQSQGQCFNQVLIWVRDGFQWHSANASGPVWIRNPDRGLRSFYEPNLLSRDDV